jgi:hypothetical protein
LDRYLYDPETPYTSPDAKKLFDHLDFVFIDGDASLLPWFPRAEKLVTLLRMCKRTNKLLFAASCGMQGFMYLYSCAQRIRRVVNGAGKGGSLGDAQKLSRETLGKLRPGEVLLDNSTGDIYEYDPLQHEFFPIGNVGLHYRKAVEDNQAVHAAMLSCVSSPPKAVADPYPLFASKLTETICHVNRPYVQHWLMRELASCEFLVPLINTWDVHPVNLTVKDTNMKILAFGTKGPMVVVYVNTVAVQFSVSERYPATLTLLRAFIQYNMKRFQDDSGKLALRLDQIQYEYGSKATCINLDRSRHRTAAPESDYQQPARRPESSQSSLARPRTAASFSFLSGPLNTAIGAKILTEVLIRPQTAVKNSGFTFSKRFHEQFVVENNAMKHIPIPLYAEQMPNSRFGRTNSPNLKLQQGPTANLTIRGDFDKNRSVELLKRVIGVGNTVETGPIKQLEHSISHSSDIAEDSNPLGSTFEYHTESFSGPQPGDVQHWKTQSEIRELLHPGYPIEKMPKQGPHTFKSRSLSTLSLKKPVRLIVPRVPSHVKIRPTKEEKCGIGNDGSVYEDPDIKRRRIELEDRKKWVASRDFRAFGRVGRSAPVEPDLSGKPPFQHEFREAHKGKWLNGNFRV